jgi:hypothetical protein
MPLAAPGLETPGGGRISRFTAAQDAPREKRSVEQLFDVAAEIELGAGQGDDSTEPGLHFGWQVTSRHQALCFGANRVERLHEVSLFQFTGIVGHMS